MFNAVHTVDEVAQRIARLAEFAILDTPPEQEFDTVVELACRSFAVPIATVSLVDDHRLWVKARAGVDVRELPREHTLSDHVVRRNEEIVVEDTLRDPRFAANPLVAGEAHIRFYAGVPLRPRTPASAAAAVAIGTLCIVDRVPRAFSAEDRAQLRALASLVEALIGARASVADAARLSRELNERALTVDRVNRQLAQAERMAEVGSWRFDLRTGALTWSDHVYAIHDLPREAQPSVETALDFYPERERGRVQHFIRRAAETGAPFDFESDFITAKGTVRRVRSIGEVELVDGERAALIGVFQDVTTRHRREQSLRQAATTDGLTGLPNRAMFEERLAQLAAHRGTRAAPYALLLIDLDGFKAVNDTLGHHAGDEVLRVMAARLAGESFRHVFAARLGGDEFVILVERARDCASLALLVRTVLRTLRHTLAGDAGGCTVAATVGAALSEDATATKQTLHEADLALYAAKRTQRGSGRIFGRADPIEP